jgi:hypothetical protein
MMTVNIRGGGPTSEESPDVAKILATPAGTPRKPPLTPPDGRRAPPPRADTLRSAPRAEITHIPTITSPLTAMDGPEADGIAAWAAQPVFDERQADGQAGLCTPSRDVLL